jgi:AAA-like domain
MKRLPLRKLACPIPQTKSTALTPIMEKFFNNAGPQQPSSNYTLDPLRRIKLEELEELIDQSRYFVLHAPRQTGKTTSLYAMMRHYNAGSKYRALYVNIEAGQAFREDVQKAMASICGNLVEDAKLHLNDTHIQAAYVQWQANNTYQDDPLRFCIEQLAKHDSQQPQNPRPLILMIDEIDALIGDTLISVLRQIRAGYNNRPHAFPQSIILCGVRDVRDYRIHSSRSKEIITGGSAFNIKAESIRLGNFSEAEVNELYDQHTAATGQVFTEEARALAWHYTQGQPWLVNALAYDITFRMREMRDRTIPITGEVMRQAKERMVLSRATHLDQLIDKLQESRVRSIIAPLLISEDVDASSLDPDDLQYCIDLGLVRQGANVALGHGSKGIDIANAIYREVIPRELTHMAQVSFDNSSLDNYNPQRAWYMRIDEQGRTWIDMPKLLGLFQQFYRENSEHWLSGMQYREAGPQLLLQAYLQRIVNGGGRIEREYGLGRGRTDLYITWPAAPNPYQREVIEIKVKRAKDSLETVIAKGTVQTREYMQRCGATLGHLVVLDPDMGASWDEKIYSRDLEDGIVLWGC